MAQPPGSNAKLPVLDSTTSETNSTPIPAAASPAGALKTPDSLIKKPEPGDASKGTIPSDTTLPKQSNPEPLKLVKRTYGNKQVLLATGMMIFVVAIMTAAQQWNPR